MAAAPLVFRYRMSTLNDVLSEYPHRSALPARPIGTIWPYVGSPPSRMSFLLFNQMLETLHAGSYYALGSFQTLADALVSAVGHHGGTYCLGSEVTRIVIDGDRAAGVEIAGGRVLGARAVVFQRGTHTRHSASWWAGTCSRRTFAGVSIAAACHLPRSRSTECCTPIPSRWD